MTRRVVITGIGAITAIGSGKDGLWQGILRGQSGIRRITRFDASQFSSQVAGEIDDFDPLAYFEPRRLKRLDRFAQFSLVVATMALEDAALADPSSRRREEAEVLDALHEPPAEPTPNPSQEGNCGFGLPSSGGVRGGFMVPMRDQKVVDATQETSASSRRR